MISVLIYTKDQCAFCDRAKELLQSKGMQYTESRIGVDILREDFMCLFPEVRSVPFIIIDGEQIGGYNELNAYFDGKDGGQLLNG
jgi:glutaredoxin 3